MTIDRVRELYAQADEATLLMSRRDVHVQGLDSFVLINDDGELTRMFYARTDELLRNTPYSPAYSVGIHNHRYGLWLTGVLGKAVSYHFVDVGARILTPHSLYRYDWRSQLSADPGWRRHESMHNLELLESSYIGDDSGSLYMSADKLHTVWAEPGAAWLVDEGITTTAVTHMYTQQKQIDVRGLYNKFEDIRHVRETLETILA